MMNVIHVAGRQAIPVFLYALSTCGWCRKTKALLNELGVAYDYVDVDLETGESAQTTKAEVMRWNPNCSFPTIVVNNAEGIVGFDEARLRELLG
jgi:glutaredoxin-like protein NrdH